MDSDLVWLDATELARLVAAGEVSPVEVVQAHLDRIEAVGKDVNAFVTVLAEQALDAAVRRPTGLVGGVPFTVKDSFDTAGVRWWQDFDVLLWPVVTIPTPRHGQSRYIVDGQEVPARHVMRATVPFNLTGLAAVLLPFGTTSAGLPIGLQLVGRGWTDDDLLGLAGRLEPSAQFEADAPLCPDRAAVCPST